MKRTRDNSSLPGPSSTPPSQRLCLSLREKKARQDKVKEAESRFSLVTDEEAWTASKGGVPANTNKTLAAFSGSMTGCTININY